MPNLIRRRDEGAGRTRGLDPFEVMEEMLRWDPFREMSRLGPREAAFVPTFEVKETKGAYLFKADLPGVKESDLEINLTGTRLTVSGHRQEEKREEGEQLYCYERSYGSFSRAFTLPEGIDAEHVSAELKEGVLTLVVPKKPEVQPRKIEVKGGAVEVKKANA
jgi:HSP20 family protein